MIRSFCSIKAIRQSSIFISTAKEIRKEIFIPSWINLSEISKDDLKEISKKLGNNYLTQTTRCPIFPVQGILWMPNYRPFVNFIVENESKQIIIPFLIINSISEVLLSEESIRSLEFSSHTTEGKVKIHGFPNIPFFLFPKNHHHYQSMNILGSNYFHITGCSHLQNKDDKSILIDHPTIKCQKPFHDLDL
jgi:hypothetical protein